MNNIKHRKKTLSQIFVNKIIVRFLLLWLAGYFAVAGELYKLTISLVNKSLAKYLLIIYAVVMAICSIDIVINAFYLVNPYLLNKKYLPRLIRKCMKEYESQYN